MTTELPSGTYLVEAVLPGSDPPSFAEVYRTVEDESSQSSERVRRNVAHGFARNTCLLRDISISPQGDAIDEMVAISISDDERQRNPGLPAMLYIDAAQTRVTQLAGNARLKGMISISDKNEPFVKYSSAVRWAEDRQVRLPTASEYDAIVAAVKRGDARFVKKGGPASMEDLFDSYPEWSTTIYSDLRIDGTRAVRHLRAMHVLKGFDRSRELADTLPWIDNLLLADPDAISADICMRGVRSATPRFVKP
jgi:hypothetical protein